MIEFLLRYRFKHRDKGLKTPAGSDKMRFDLRFSVERHLSPVKIPDEMLAMELKCNSSFNTRHWDRLLKTPVGREVMRFLWSPSVVRAFSPAKLPAEMDVMELKDRYSTTH